MLGLLDTDDPAVNETQYSFSLIWIFVGDLPCAALSLLGTSDTMVGEGMTEILAVMDVDFSGGEEYKQDRQLKSVY